VPAGAAGEAENEYLIGERKITIEAKTSNQAKRKACKYWRIKPSDKWCGINSLKASMI